MFSKKEFAIISNLRFIGRTNSAELSMKKSFITSGPEDYFSYVEDCLQTTLGPCFTLSILAELSWLRAVWSLSNWKY